MIVVEQTRGTPEWRAAHIGCITPSDCSALLARTDTKKHRALIERLVLDSEHIDNHVVEHPDPWKEEHEVALTAALASFRKRWPKRTLHTVGFVRSSEFSWLGASPHALIGRNCVLLIRTHTTLRGFHTYREFVAERARQQLLMFVVDATRCEVFDYWDGGGTVPDKWRMRSVQFDREWLIERVLPRMVTVWDEVGAALKSRSLRDQEVATRAPP